MCSSDFFFSSRRRHTRYWRDWSSDVCSSDLHNGFSHQGPGLIDVMLSKRGTVARIYLPPDANCLLSVADHCLRSRNYVNLIVVDKQPHLQYLPIEDAIAHCAAEIGRASCRERV